MFDWINDVFKKSKRLSEKELEELREREREEYMANIVITNLECEGDYLYKIEEGVSHSNWGLRHTHNVMIEYTMNVTVEGELESVRVTGRATLEDFYRQEEAYEFIIESMETGVDSFMDKFKDSIIREYKLHLAEKNIARLEQMLKDSKPIKVSFKAEMVK